MKRKITPYHVGGALYIPATHKNLEKVLTQQYYPFLRSVIVDFEDAIYEDALAEATDDFSRVIKDIPKQELLIFVRARDSAHLQRLLSLSHIGRIDGFVIAKCDTRSMRLPFDLIPERFWIMPVLESTEVFSLRKIEEIGNFFTSQKERILMLRFGAEDLSTHLGLRRDCDTSLYDLPPIAHIVNTLVLHFKPLGFTISGGVYTCFANRDGFREELKKDLRSALFGKTLIHPDQALLCNEHYKVTLADYETALKISEEGAPAIFARQGMMVETVPHRRWAEGIIARGEIYGVQ